MRDFVHSVGMTANLPMQEEDRLAEDVMCHSDVMGWRGCYWRFKEDTYRCFEEDSPGREEHEERVL